MPVIDVNNYVSYLEDKELSPNAIKSYANTLKQLNSFFEDNGIQEINKKSLIQFKNWLSTKYKNIKTINSKIVTINIYLKWAIKEGELTGVELDKIKLKHLKIQNISHKEYISEADYKKLCNHAKNEELKLFMYVIGNSGLRITEVMSLRKRDLEETLIKITNKGKSRNVALPMWLRKQLKNYMGNLNDDELIFRKSQQYYRDQLKKTAALAKVKKGRVYPHSFRHYFAKNYLANGGDLGTLQQMLGHSNINTTAIYLKLNDDELAEAFRKQKNK